MKNASLIGTCCAHVYVCISPTYGAAVAASSSFLCIRLLHRIANAVHAPIAVSVLFLFLLSVPAKQTCASIENCLSIYHRIEFTALFGNVKAIFEYFSLNALSLLFLLLVVYLSSHHSNSVGFLSSAKLNSFMGITSMHLYEYA